MQEIFEFRINNDNYKLLPKLNNGQDNGVVHIVTLTKDDSNFQEIKKLSERIKREEKESFFFGWNEWRIAGSNR